MKKLMNLVLVLSLLILPGCNWFSCDCPHDGHTHAHHAAPQEEESSAPQASDVATETFSVIKISSSQDFKKKVIAATKPVVVDFNAKWCGPCQSMKPIFEELAQEMGQKYIFADVNVDDVDDIANQYNIKGIPTFTFFKDGKEVVSPNNRLTGAMDKNALIAAIKKHLG